MIQIVIFILLSILLLVFTLMRPHRYRFPRFFAFESFLGLVLLNVRNWFRNPFSLIQLASWILLTGSCVLAFHGFRLLITAGAPKGDIEETTQLITIGAYRYVRHPMYGSLLPGGAGAFLKDPSFLGLILFLILVGSVFVTAKIEEEGNIIRFGEKYRAYKKTTKMFIPFLI